MAATIRSSRLDGPHRRGLQLLGIRCSDSIRDQCLVDVTNALLIFPNPSLETTALSKLDLGDNQIGDQGAGVLAGVLSQCPHMDIFFGTRARVMATQLVIAIVLTSVLPLRSWSNFRSKISTTAFRVRDNGPLLWAKDSDCIHHPCNTKQAWEIGASPSSHTFL